MHLTVYSARDKSNLNVTSVFICIVHVIMHACNMDVLAHGNIWAWPLQEILHSPGCNLCACVHIITRVLPCAAHTQRIATPCLSYKHFGVYVNKQCTMHKAYVIPRTVYYTTNNGKYWLHMGTGRFWQSGLPQRDLDRAVVLCRHALCCRFTSPVKMRSDAAKFSQSLRTENTVMC